MQFLQNKNNLISFLSFILFTFILQFNFGFAKEYSNCSRIIIDGYFDDWEGIASISDAVGDSKTYLDILEVKYSQNDEYYFFYVKFDKEIFIQQDNTIFLYLDTDNSAGSGDLINMTGADFIWEFGNRKGTFIIDDKRNIIKHSDIGFVAMPTVTSDRYEFSISKTAAPYGKPLFPGNAFKFVLTTNGSGDMIPEKNENITLLKTECDQIELPPISPEKSEGNFRVSSWNVLKDNISTTELSPIFKKIISAINPDIIGFCEVYDTSEEYIAGIMKQAIPSKDWSARKQPYCDVILATHYSILDNHQLNGNAAFLIDMRPDFDTKALVIVAHLPAMQENDKRMAEVVNIINYIKSVKNNTADISLPANSPIFIVGDMNFVGYASQLLMMKNGSLEQTGIYIDWDGTPFADSDARITHKPFSYTWINNNSYYWPGKLDFIFYSDAATSNIKSFSFNSAVLPTDLLTKYNLNADDSYKCTDHLPISADFTMKGTSINEDKGSGMYISPNPASEYIEILPLASSVRGNWNDKSPSVRGTKGGGSEIQIFNYMGELVKNLSPALSKGEGVRIDISQLPTGVYFIKIGDKFAKFVKE